MRNSSPVLKLKDYWSEFFMNNEQCPKCESVNIYQDGPLWICPECSHEWTENDLAKNFTEDIKDNNQTTDANGAVLNSGDSVIVIKDLKIKGASGTVKSGTKVKNIRLIDGEDGHDIACKIDGLGAINLKSEFVKKS